MPIIDLTVETDAPNLAAPNALAPRVRLWIVRRRSGRFGGGSEMTTSRSAVDESVATVGSSIDRLLPSSARPRVARELALMTILFLVYRQIRYLTRDDVDVAFSNARRVVEVERFVGVFNEAAVQDMVMNHDVVIRFFNHYYALVHFPATALFVIWVLVRHPDSYRRIRTWIVSVTAAALAIHVGFPLAPPRMLDREDFVDTLATYGPHIYSANTEQSVANQFAAMPSLHFGWAVIVAAGFVGIHRSRISRIAFIHPIITLLAIVATANHFWVDAAVALCIVAGAHYLLNHNKTPIWSPSSARHQTRPPRTSWARFNSSSHVCGVTTTGSASDDDATPKAHRREPQPLLPTT